MLLQIDTIALAEEAIIEAAEPAQESINLFEMAQYGGWIMVILAILLAVACYIFIARLVVIKQATREDKSFMDRIRDYIHEGKIDSAINLCKQTDTPSAHMI
jgi:biopolymer transport protein ExbB